MATGESGFGFPVQWQLLQDPEVQPEHPDPPFEDTNPLSPLCANLLISLDTFLLPHSGQAILAAEPRTSSSKSVLHFAQ